MAERHAAAAAFDDLVEHYDEGPHHHEFARALIEGVAGSSGATSSPVDVVLDVATGTGIAAFAALRLLMPRRLIAVDVSPGMLDKAREKAAEADPDRRITWHLGPAVPAPVEDRSVDLVCCASALHFLGRAALTDWSRVLRPGGRVAFSLPCRADFRPSGVFADLIAADLPVPDDEDQAAAVAREAGFVDVDVRRFVGAESGRTAFLVFAERCGQAATR